jgi:hypothetical protein
MITFVVSTVMKNGLVEIIFCGEATDQKILLDDLISWSKKGGDESRGIKNYQIYDYQVEDDAFDDFTIERSDDLAEMVWALRGASWFTTRIS